MSRYATPDSGEWVKPVRRGYRMMCCDCGLVHNVDFRVLKDKRGCFIQFRAERNNRSTALARRHRKRKTK